LPATPPDTDDFGAALPTDASFAARVVSLNPAATEVIFAIGAQSRLVGRSAWDEFPAEARSVPSLGNGIRPNVEAVLEARPTLVVLYATAENRAAADALARAGVRVIALRVDHISQFVSLTRRLGIALGAVEGAATVVDSVQRTLAVVSELTKDASPRMVVWPLWQQPVMVVGAGSYLDELVVIAGGRNVFHDFVAPSPIVSVEEIARRNPDVIVASPATSAELRARRQWRAVRAVRDSQWITHDPALTGRPSIVLGMAAVSLARALHPELASRLPALPASPSRAP
jgi:ABC-type Fe3+-hydroxamate transport system substrate-binding protein